ncbi:MAG: MMPL family transporter, partial [Candidatus Rokubacteria bacterium]|nr:MMPL family transporter [Candidatus Rokubacteria bacterium]
IPRMMQRLGEFNLRYRMPIAVVTGVVVVGSLVGWYSLRVNTDFISYFPERSFIRQRTKDLHESLSGAVNFSVVVETGREDGIKEPDLLGKIAKLQEFLAGTGWIDKTVSVADYLRKMHREMNGGDPAQEVVPDTREQVAQYLLTLEGKELAKYVDFNYSTANIVVRHNITSSGELSALLKQLEAHIAQTFPQNVNVRFTGETILVNNAADYMAINEITSFSSTFIVIGLIHALLFMSLRAGFLSLIPNVFPILTNFGLMGLLGIPLNTGTALIATIAIGIAVDDTVHHMVTYSRQLNEHHDQKIAMFNTMKAQGRPIIYVSAALAGGFLVLAFSNFVPTFYFGVLSALVMLVAMVAELVLTPLLMYSTRLVTLWDMVLLKMNRELIRAAPLFRGLSQWEARKVVLLGMLQSLQPGEFVVRKGEVGRSMYMVVSGRLRAFDTEASGGSLRHGSQRRRADACHPRPRRGLRRGRPARRGNPHRQRHRRNPHRGPPARPAGPGAPAETLPVHGGEALPQPRQHPGRAPPGSDGGAHARGSPGGRTLRTLTVTGRLSR